MRFPFDLFTSPGLGISHSSFDQVSLQASRKISPQTAIAINAATGNVVLKDAQFNIEDDGITITLGMIWNSKDMQFRLAATPQIKNIELSNRITVIEPDGREVDFVKSETSPDRYVCVEPDKHGLSYLTISEGEETHYERYFPDSGHKEVFNSVGEIKEKILPSGKKITYQLNQGKLSEILLPSMRKISINGDEFESSLCLTENGNIETLAHFEQQDETFTTTIDNVKTTYQYINNQLTILNNDTVAAILTFDENNSIEQLIEGDREWNFEKSLNSFVVADGYDNVYKIGLNGPNLASFTLPTDHAPALYDFKNSQLQSVTDPDGQARSIHYDLVTGLPKEVTDSLGRKTLTTYSKDGLKLSETTLEEKTSITKQFVYADNAKRQCIFEVSAAGRVTRYEYDENDHLIAIKKITTRFFNDDISSIHDWWNAISDDEKATCQIETFAYDKYGRLCETKNDTHVIKILDSIGRTIEWEEELKPNHYRTIENEFDHLNRITQCNEVTRKTKYAYQTNQTIITHQDQAGGNELIKSLTYDAGGLLLSQSRSDEKIERREDYVLDKAGVVRKIKLEDNQNVSQYFDTAGRLQFKISPDGQLSEYQYDVRGKLSCQKEYNTTLPKDDLKTSEALKQYLSENPPKNLTRYTLLDSEGQLRFEIRVKLEGAEPKAYIKEHQYFLGNKIRTIEYNHAVTDIDKLDYETLSSPDKTPIVIMDGLDREKRYFYDADNLLIGEQDAFGFLKEYKIDGAGNILQEIHYLKKSKYADNLAEARPDISDALITSFEYDTFGRKVKTIDPDGIIKTFSYYPNGKLWEEITYQNEIEILKITHEYDDLGRENKIINSQNKLQIDICYDSEDNEISRTLTDLLTNKSRVIKKHFNAFNELEKEATPRINDTQSDWIHHEIEPGTGLVLYTDDALKNRTIYYYDENRRPVIEINAEGHVTTYRYDVICSKETQKYQYYTPLKPEVLSTLTGGFVNETIQNMLPPASTKDRLTQNEYDAEGLLIKQITPNNAIHQFEYNSFNECITETHIDNDNKTLVIHHEYDLKGNKTRTIKDPSGLNIEETEKFDDVLNRPTEIKDEAGNITTITYKGLRENHYVDTLGQKTVKRDALMRLQSETDWYSLDAKSEAAQTHHEYQDETRTHIITTPENRKTIEINNAFGEVETRVINGQKTEYQFDVDGKINKTTYADGSEVTDFYNVMGWHQSTINSDHKTIRYEMNKVGQITSSIEDEKEENLVTLFKPNAFDENESITDPDGQVKTTEFNLDGLAKTITTDANHLKLVTTNHYTNGGALKTVQQGDSTAPIQYQENIETDILNRELTRKVALDHSMLTLKAQVFDSAGRIVELRDGNGNVRRNFYDLRGNLRFAIDAEGFVVEKTFAANNKEITRRSYAIRLTPEQLSGLTKESNLADVQALLKPSHEDSVKQSIYDNDGLLRFEVNSVLFYMASVDEWRYDQNGQCVQRIRYANYLNINEKLEFDLSTLVLNPTKDRVTDFSRNKRGKIVLVRNAEGYVHEKRRDAKGRVIAAIQYADKAPTLDFSASYYDLQEILKASNRKRENYFIYDVFDNLRFQIDAKGFVTEFRYDKNKRKTDTFYYHDQLTSETLKELIPLLECDDETRNPSQIINSLNLVITKNETKDIHLLTKYDTAGRIYSETDGEGNEEIFELNALNLKIGRLDKAKNKWVTEFDQAKRIKNEFSPLIDVSNVNQNADGSLSVAIQKTPVQTKHDYDDSSNLQTTTFAANQELASQTRSVKMRYNKNNQFIGTEIENVTVDDESQDTLEQHGPRPEIVLSSLTTTKVLDFAGREIVTIDENGTKHFTIYELRGRKCFEIDGDGFVTEYSYLFAFDQPDIIYHRANPIPKEILDQHPGGFTFAEMTSLVSQSLSSNDRQSNYQYDKRGLKTHCTQDEIITALENATTQEVHAALVRPTSSWEYNPFGENSLEEVLVDANGNKAQTRIFRDENGNDILTVSPNGYVTSKTFGIKNNELTRDEWVTSLSSLPVNHDDPEAILQYLKEHPQLKDRHYTFTYNKQMQQTRVQVESGDRFYQSKSDGTIADLGASSVTGIDYDAEGRSIAYLNGLGEKRYINRNERGDIIFETEFPRLIDVNSAPVIPVIKHHVDAHGQPVGSLQFANAGNVLDTKIIPPSPRPDDQQSLILTDNRGNAIVTQDATGHLKFTTFDASRRPVRNYHWVSGYQLNDHGGAEFLKHFRQNRQQYDGRGHVKMRGIKEDLASEVQTYRKINAFGECVGEGLTEDQMILENKFDKAGNKWYTNEDHGIPTVSFPDAKGDQVVSFRAPEIFLSSYENEAEASHDLLDPNYLDTFKTVRRTLMVRDYEGNVTEEYKPWYSVKPEKAPQNIQLSFVLTDDHHIQWNKPDIELLDGEFKLRLKGTEAWSGPLTIIKQGAIWSVPLSPNLPTDCYEYQLNYYYVDPDTHEREDVPSFCAEGEAMLDVGNYQNSTNLVWYTKERLFFGDMRHVLVLVGNTKDVAGIELIQNGQPVKRLAAEVFQNQLHVDLGEEVSGDYEFKIVKSFTTIPAGAYTARRYDPMYYFTSSISSQDYPQDVLPGIVVTQPSSPAIQHPGTSGRYFMNAAPRAFLYGVDSNYQQHFIDHMEGYVTGSLRDEVFYSGNPSSLAHMPGAKIILLKGSFTNQPHALGWSGGIATLHQWGNIYESRTSVVLDNNVRVLSLDQNETTNVIGRLHIRTSVKSNKMTEREISITDFSITRFGVLNPGPGGYTYMGTYYDWHTNISRDHLINISHDGLSGTISNLSIIPQPMSLDGRTTVPIRFQAIGPLDYQEAQRPSVSSPGILSYSILLNENGTSIGVPAVEIPLSSNSRPVIPRTGGRLNDPGYVRLNNQDSGRLYQQAWLSSSTYQDQHVLHFSPLPPGVASILFEFKKKTITNQDIWRRDLAISLDANHRGMSLPVTGYAPGYYDYHLKAYDASGREMDLSSVGLKPENGWFCGEMNVRHNKPGCYTFVSKSQEPIAPKICKPKTSHQYDRWHNETQTISGVGNAAPDPNQYATHNEYNALNKKIKTITPEVDVVDNHNVKTSERLVTEHLINPNGCEVARVAPNGGRRVRVINDKDDTLCEVDADNIHQTSTTDLFRRKTSIKSQSGASTTITHGLRNGLNIETRSTPGFGADEFEKNEEGRVIKQRNGLGHNTYFDYAPGGQQISRLNPLMNACTAQYDLRSGMQTFYQDEDGKQRKWIAANPYDSYFGNATDYIDLAGQEVHLELNRSKEVKSEVGKLDHVTENRGHSSASQTPPPRYVRYLHDEAGYVIEIDDGANLTTQKIHDEDGYNLICYFIGKDGEMYRATNIKYDKMHRQAVMYDTRIAIYLSYDKNDNRRNARAYLYNADVTDENLLYESWYDYTTADHVILRDCQFNAATKNIELTAKRGMRLTYGGGRVATQQTLDEEGQSHTTVMSYYDGTDFLKDAWTKEDATGNEAFSTLREYDQAKRVTQTRQIKNPRIKVVPAQPSKEQYLKYERITWVVSINTIDWAFIYYDGANPPVRYDMYTYSEPLHQIIKDWMGTPLDRMPANVIQQIKDGVSAWHKENIGLMIWDEYHRAPDDSLDQTTHREKDEKKITIRTVDIKTKTGRPLKETSVYTETISINPPSHYKIQDTTRTTLYCTTDEVKVEKAEVNRDFIEGDVTHDPLPPKAEVHTTEDSNGNIETIQGALDDQESYRFFVTTSDNLIVYKQSAQGKNYYFYAEKRPGNEESESPKMVLMAYFGDIPDQLKLEAKEVSHSDLKNGRIPKVINVDINHQAISSQFPPPMSSQYTTHNSMTYRQIASELNYTGYATEIAAANRANPEDVVPAGTTIEIPALVYEVPETAWNGSVPTMDQIIGSIYPVLVSPNIKVKPKYIPPKHKHGNIFEEFCEIAVGVAIMAFVPEAAATLLGGMQALATTAATGSLVATAEIGASFGAAGLVAGAASQAIGKFSGATPFNLTSVITQGVTSAISGGVLAAGATGSLVKEVVLAEIATIAQQVVLVQAGVQKNYDWKTLITGAVKGIVYDEFVVPENPVQTSSETSFIDTMTDGLISGQQPSFEGIAANVLGNMVGTKIGNNVNEVLTQQREKAVSKQTSSLKEAKSSPNTSNMRTVQRNSLFGQSTNIDITDPRWTSELSDRASEQRLSRQQNWTGARSQSKWERALDIAANSEVVTFINKAGETYGPLLVEIIGMELILSAGVVVAGADVLWQTSAAGYRSLRNMAGEASFFGKSTVKEVSRAESLPKFKLGSLTTEEANASYIQRGMKPPYDTRIRPRTIRLQNDKVLLRVYNEEKYVKGAWLLRPREIEGLTPLQIQDKFALPAKPTMFTEVHLPAGTYLRVGRVAAQDGWGAGGAFQYESLDVLQEELFRNRQAFVPQAQYFRRS